MTSLYQTLAQRSAADWQQRLSTFEYRISNFIDGEPCQALSGETFEVVNPATGKADRVGFKILADGKKVRVFKSSGEEVKA